MIGLAAAHWSFQFVVLLPFRHEIGSPEWRKDPKWLEDEEQGWEEEEELLRLCGWTRGRGGKKKRGAPRIGTSEDVEKPPNVQVCRRAARRGAVPCKTARPAKAKPGAWGRGGGSNPYRSSRGWAVATRPLPAHTASFYVTVVLFF